jgi:outer membrane lipase/esterase
LFYKIERPFYFYFFIQEQIAMKVWKYALSALGAALVLVGCGGGGDLPTLGTVATPTPAVTPKPVFTKMVSFGDSLSDVGTYKVGLLAAVGGGKFTVNSATAKTWTEVLAPKLNLPAPCAAQTGLSSIIPTLPAVTVQNVVTCTNYAQGSSRVTSAFGPNSVAIQQAVLLATGSTTLAINAAGIGLMAVPLVTQMANHSAKGAYSGTELVTVMAGGNDIFLNLNGVASAAGGGVGAVGAAQFAGWAPSVQGAVAGGGTTATTAAITAARAGMAQAGTELANLVKTQILAKGAKYVVVANLGSVSQTPYGVSLGAQTQGILDLMTGDFNTALTTGLAGQAGVLLVDLNAQGALQAANPSQFLIANATTPACDTSTTITQANILGGSSLACTTANTIAGDVSKYYFADGVHPTPYGHQLMSDFIESKIVAAGWK